MIRPLMSRAMRGLLAGRLAVPIQVPLVSPDKGIEQSTDGQQPELGLETCCGILRHRGPPGTAQLSPDSVPIVKEAAGSFDRVPGPLLLPSFGSFQMIEPVDHPRRVL